MLADPKLFQAMTDATKPLVGGIPVAGATLRSAPEYQMAEQAQRDFSAILRRESGAAHQPSEF